MAILVSRTTRVIIIQTKLIQAKTASPVIAETARRPDGTRQKDQTQPATESVARAVAGKARPDYTRQLSYRFLPRDDRRRTFLPEDKRDRYLAAGDNLRIRIFRSRFAGIARGGAFLRGRALFHAALLSPRELGLNESGRALLGCLPRRRANAGNCASFHLAADAAESRLQTEKCRPRRRRKSLILHRLVQHGNEILVFLFCMFLLWDSFLLIKCTMQLTVRVPQAE